MLGVLLLERNVFIFIRHIYQFLSIEKYLISKVYLQCFENYEFYANSSFSRFKNAAA